MAEHEAFENFGEGPSIPLELFPTSGLDFEGKRLHYRRDYPIIESETYLNHAAHGPWSIKSSEAMKNFIDSFCEGPMLDYTEWYALQDRTRALLAQMLNAEVDEIGFNYNTSLSLILLSRCVDWQKGDNIIVSDREYPSVVMPAKLLEQWGVEARIVDTVDGLTSVDKLLDAIDGRTRMIISSLVNFLTGQRVDIKKLAKGCRQAGIILVVDAIQAAGPLKIDVKDLGCHALTFGSPKWMLGPMGVGTIYLERESIGKLKIPQIGMYSVPEPWNFFDYNQPINCQCSRFECGTQNFVAHYGFHHNVEMFLDLGQANIEKYLLELTGKLHDELTRNGIKVITPRADKGRAAIITFDAESAGWPDAKALIDHLAKSKVSVATRMGMVRVSPHFYNEWHEVEKFLDLTIKKTHGS
jgi:cysteine desulfurase / selenocysteine lyase